MHASLCVIIAIVEQCTVICGQSCQYWRLSWWLLSFFLACSFQACFHL